MPKKDPIQKELAEMRAQLEASEANEAAVSGGDAPTEKAPAEVDAGTAPVVTAAETGGEPVETDAEETPAADLSTQFQELLDGLNRELKDSNPITLLAVFGLGILFGRLLSR